MTDTRLEEIRARAAAATPGPWVWDGRISKSGRSGQFLLATKYHGMQTILTFDGVGMCGADLMLRECQDESNRLEYGYLRSALELAIYEVEPEATKRTDARVYRGDVVGFRNPDATFIAEARADIDYLLGVIDQLTGATNSEGDE